MSILSNQDNLIELDEPKKREEYQLPAVFYDDEKEMSLGKSLLLSFFLHPIVAGSIWLISTALVLLGLVIPVAKRPDLKPKDIEFVLVEKEATPINKKTPYRADRNSRAGGKHDPTKKVSLPTAPGAKTQKPAAAPSKTKAKAEPKQSPVKNPLKAITQATQKPVQQPTKQPTVAATGGQPSEPRKTPPTAKPSLKPAMTPKITDRPTSKFTVPVPTGGTQAGKYSTGPVSGSGKGAAQAVGSAKGTGAGRPSPTLAPTGGSSAGSGTKMAHGGGGYGSGGNPGPGNPNGAPGIDAIREPDFGPYMRDLQRRIKMNWDPPKGDQSKRVVLMFKIAKDGRLLSCSVYKSSGLPNADKAAIQAVQLTAPFKPLPPDFKGSSIDIQFTFDYNVFGANGYN